MNFAKFLRTPVLKNICEPLLLKITWHYNPKIFRKVFYMKVFYPSSHRYKIKKRLMQLSVSLVGQI